MPHPRKSRSQRTGHRLAAAGALIVSTLIVGTSVTAPAFSAGDATTAREKARVDAIATPQLDWYPCYEGKQCATVELPMDYDKPKGAQVEIALLKSPATSTDRLGTLFVNPGGPGGSGTAIARFADQVVSPEVLKHFDVVGFDPRGIAASDNVKCFNSTKDQTRALAGMNTPFPYTSAEKKEYLSSAAQLAFNCALNGRPLAANMSTAEVARDMDVLRRAVGDRQLTYLGFSYGTYLGQVYANMFPDRVRAIVIDGVLNPVAWAGTPATRNIPVTLRIRSAQGTQKALTEMMKRCDAAGPKFCEISGHAMSKYQLALQRLQAHPLVTVDPDTEKPTTLTYAQLVTGTLSALYGAYGPEAVASEVSAVLAATDPKAAKKTRANAAQRLLVTLKTIGAKASSPVQHGFDFPYDNGSEAFSSVLCSDSLNPYSPSRWNPAIEADRATGGDFSRAWGWESVQCAKQYWTSSDEDAYRGPFTRATAHPVLVVGDYYDPATNYSGAVAASKLLPNSRLLSSNSWGHTAYGTSKCVTTKVDNYLLRTVVPAAGTVCTGDYQPFTTANGKPASTKAASAMYRVPMAVRLTELAAPRH